MSASARSETSATSELDEPPRRAYPLSNDISEETAGTSMSREETQKIYRGDIFWAAPDDQRAPAPSYSHPHVVIQDDLFNHSRITTIIVCALTSNLHRAKEPGNVLLEAGEGSLPKQSVVVVSQISSIEKSALGEKIGSLSSERVEQILTGLRFLQSFFPR